MIKSSRKGDGPAQGLSRSEQREIAKAGMITSLGTLVLTGFLRFKGAGLLHAWAGLFLVGCSLWHHFLNQPKKIQPPEKAPRPVAMATGSRPTRKAER
jgi:hypothetical protein